MSSGNLISEISTGTGLSASDVVRTLKNGPRRYKVYQIPKRHGRGMRTIAHPAKELKIIQRYLSRALLAKLPVSVAAAAYISKRSIRDNALAHAQNAFILKLDFRDFFPSVVPLDLINRIPQFRNDPNATLILTQALFWQRREDGRLCLSIGAPSSPAVSNIVMYEIDERIRLLAEAQSLTYTRYADDITISGQVEAAVVSFERMVRNILSESATPRLVINEDKRGLYSRGMKRMVTGLKLTPEGEVSLGRERKRLVSSAVHRLKVRGGTEVDWQKTRGWLAFAKAADPDFLRRLRTKYGVIVDEILTRPSRRLKQVPRQPRWLR